MIRLLLLVAMNDLVVGAVWKRAFVRFWGTLEACRGLGGGKLALAKNTQKNRFGQRLYAHV